MKRNQVALSDDASDLGPRVPWRSRCPMPPERLPRNPRAQSRVKAPTARLRHVSRSLIGCSLVGRTGVARASSFWSRRALRRRVEAAAGGRALRPQRLLTGALALRLPQKEPRVERLTRICKHAVADLSVTAELLRMPSELFKVAFPRVQGMRCCGTGPAGFRKRGVDPERVLVGGDFGYVAFVIDGACGDPADAVEGSVL